MSWESVEYKMTETLRRYADKYKEQNRSPRFGIWLAQFLEDNLTEEENACAVTSYWQFYYKCGATCRENKELVKFVEQHDKIWLKILGKLEIIFDEME